MMWMFGKKAICAFLFCSVAILCGATEQIGRSESGAVQAAGLEFSIVHWSKDYLTTDQRRAGTVVFPAEGGRKTADGIRRDGAFRLSKNIQFDLSETFQRLSAQKIKLEYKMRSENGIPSAFISFQTRIPLKEYQRNPAVFNGKPIEIGKKDAYESRTPGGELILKRPGGTLHIEGNFSVALHALPRQAELRLLFKGGNGKVKSAELNLKMEFRPTPSFPVNLRPAMNMAFRDNQANDGVGGWTDQGPENDLSPMKPGKLDCQGIDFDIVDPATNGGKSCIALRGPARPSFQTAASVDTHGIAGKYLYLLNAAAWTPKPETPIGKVRISYADGSFEEHSLLSGIDTGNFWNPRPLKNATVAWKAKNASAPIGLYATKICREKSGTPAKLELISLNQVWLVLAATFSDNPGESASSKPEKITLTENGDWFRIPFAFKTEKGSAADLSFLADAPAGKYGFLKVANGHFEFEKRPRKPVRFWGANICFFSQKITQNDILTVLDDLVALGFNSIRLHHFDAWLTHYAPTQGMPDPENMRKLDFLFSEAKKRGLYLTLDLFTIRPVPEIVRFGKLSKEEYKVLCYFDPECRKNLMNFAQHLLTHVNPYTGVAWKDDPALILINLINEGTLTVQLPRVKKEIAQLVDRQFAEFLAREKASGQSMSPDCAREKFLAEAGTVFFTRMKKELAALGVKIPLSDQNFARPAKGTRNVYDYIDTHFYWGHPVYLGKKLWQPPFFTEPASTIPECLGGIGRVFGERVFGKPFTISEWNHCFPNPHHFEGPFLTAAYSSLQDYSGLWQFNYGSVSAWIARPGRLTPFDFYANPVMKLASRAGALLYARGDVSTARLQIPFPRGTGNNVIKHLGLIAQTGVEKNPEQAPFPPNAAWTVAARQLVRTGMIPADSINFQTGRIRSATGELVLDPKAGIFRAITPRSEVLLLPTDKRAVGKFLAVSNGNSFAAFAALSLDGKALPQSSRILLLHLTDVKNRNSVFLDRSMGTIEAEGEPELLLRRNRAEISLKYPGKCNIYACSSTGKRLFEIPVRRDGDTLTFQAANDAGNNRGILMYELTKR